MKNLRTPGQVPRKEGAPEILLPKMIGRKELTELSPRNSVRVKNSQSSVFETVLSETVFGLFPTIEN